MKLYVQRVACSADGNVVYALSEAEKRLMKSSDAGATWATIQSPCEFGAFACSPDGLTVFAVQRGWPQMILVSRDGGLNFSEIQTKVGYRRIELSKSGKLLYGLYKGEYHLSRDGGSTWVVSKKAYKPGAGCGEVAPHPKDRRAKSNSGEIIYKARGKEHRVPKKRLGTLFKSINAGKTWIELNPSYDLPPEVWINADGEVPDPRVAEMEAKRKRYRLKEPLGWYSNEAREMLDQQDIADGGVPGVDFGNGPGKP